MNLHGIVSNAIGMVNPFIRADLLRSTGYITQPDGSRTPTYTALRNIRIQVQGLTNDELKQIEGLNIQASKNAVYLSGDCDVVVRPERIGGDMLKFGGQTWLVITVLEEWPDWSKVLVVLQNG